MDTRVRVRNVNSTSGCGVQRLGHVLMGNDTATPAFSSSSPFEIWPVRISSTVSFWAHLCREFPCMKPATLGFSRQMTHVLPASPVPAIPAPTAATRSLFTGHGPGRRPCGDHDARC